MRRRQFLKVIGGAAAAWPLAARAQQSGGMRRVGILVHGLQTDPEWQQRVVAFREGLERLGWVDGRSLHIELRFSANQYDRLPELAQEVVAQNPDAIFATTTPATKALQLSTRTIPIVFVQVSDPTGSGVVTSLARPGGNITGLLFFEESVAGKWLGMLKEIAPSLTRAALIGNPKGFPYAYFLRTAHAIAPALRVEIVPNPTANASDIESSIESFARVPNGGLLVPPDNTIDEHRDLVIRLAARSAQPLARGLCRPPLRHCRRADVLRHRRAHAVSSGGDLRRSYIAWGQTGRSAGRGANEVRNHPQPQDRQGAGPGCASNLTGARRRGDRIRMQPAAARNDAKGTERTKDDVRNSVPNRGKAEVARMVRNRR